MSTFFEYTFHISQAVGSFYRIWKVVVAVLDVGSKWDVYALAPFDGILDGRRRVFAAN